jgi:hypothetical protein
MEKLTAVEWYSIETHKINVDLKCDRIKPDEAMSRYMDTYSKAKEMEKEQMKQIMWDLTDIDTTKTNKGLVIDNMFEQYYNETFKTE